MSLTSQPIVIVGMQRSGTSSVAQALSKLGVLFGEELLAPDANNEAGYFELVEQVRVHKDILFAFHHPWNSVKPLPDNWREFPQAPRALRELTALLEKHFSGHERWGFKEPTAALLLPLYNSIFKDLGLSPTYVICVRNPLEVVDSVNRHARSYLEPRLHSQPANPQTAGQELLAAPLGRLAFGTWLHLTLKSLKETRGHRRVVVVYDDFLLDAESVLRSIVNWSASSAEWEEAVGGIRLDLRHHQKSDEELAGLLRDTFALCVEASRDTDGFNSSAFDARIDALWDEFRLNQETFGAPAPILGDLVATWRGPREVQSSECFFEVSNNWQTVTLEIDAPANGEVIGSIYHQPCVAWIRKANWLTARGSSAVRLEAGPSCRLTSEEGCQRLFASAEVFQFRTFTPAEPGPYKLELDFWLEVDPRVVMEGVTELVNNLTGLRQRVAMLEQQLRAGRPQQARFFAKPRGSG